MAAGYKEKMMMTCDTVKISIYVGQISNTIQKIRSAYWHSKAENYASGQIATQYLVYSKVDDFMTLNTEHSKIIFYYKQFIYNFVYTGIRSV